MRFEWDVNKAAENKRKHGGVSFEEATEVFFDSSSYEDFDNEHSGAQEKRFIRIGNSSKRLLRVSFTVRVEANENEIIRIISARKSGMEEEQQYYEHNKH